MARIPETDRDLRAKETGAAEIDEPWKEESKSLVEERERVEAKAAI